MPAPKPYYLVAIPKGDVMQELVHLQKFISRKFQMYTKHYPSLHVTVGVIEYCKDIDRLSPVLQNIVKTYPRFTVHIHGQRCFHAPYLSVGVAVHSQTLSHLTGNLEGTLINGGFCARSFSDWDFHISLVSPHFANRSWNNREFQEACRIVERHTPSGNCFIDRLELWEPEFPPLNILEQFFFE